MSNCKFIWIIGSPRSGSTFLCDYIGKFTDRTYNEPWKTHHIENSRQWVFPKAKSIVFKYCENWRNLHVLLNKYPQSVYVHVYRDPDNVVYSMANDKTNSYPRRNLYGGYEGDERIKLCMERWYSNTMHCLSLHNLIPRQYTELKYENLKPGLEKLSKMTGIDFDLTKLNFENRNDDFPELNWDLNKPAKRLRNLVKNFDGKCLATWINEKRPKLLQRVIS